MQTKLVKFAWFFIVCTGFLFAGVIINNSYAKWQESPIATTISTKPISDLEFPVVTVCPPKGSNTALNYDLIKADNVTLTTADRDRIREKTFQIFIESSHEEFATHMLSSVDPEMIAEGSQSVPVPYGKNGFETLQWKDSGSIKTPWYGEEFNEEYYLRDKYHHRVLDFPKDLADQVGKGTLLIELEIDTQVEDGWDEWVGYKEGSKYKLYQEKKTQYEAKRHCQEEGGHLASILSEWENSQVAQVAGLQFSTSLDEPWIGGVMDDLGE